jgi:hypothetical protein
MTAATPNRLRRKVLLCCCPECVAVFPGRLRDLEDAKRTLRRDMFMKPGDMRGRRKPQGGPS